MAEGPNPTEGLTRDKEPRLTLQAEKAIRNYLIKLLAVPSVIVTILSFMLGFLINTGAIKKAEFDAVKKFTETLDTIRNKVDAFRENLIDKRLEAQSTLDKITKLS
jgi:hypothetical protein